MQLRTILPAAVVALTLIGANVAHATGTLTENGTPTAGWPYGTGNNYAPADTMLLTLDDGTQIFGRDHVTFQPATASAGGVYSYPTGSPFFSFDWGIYSPVVPLSNVTALITLTNKNDHSSFSYNPLGVGNDNYTTSTLAENSFRWNWPPINFNPLVDGTYNFNMDVSDQTHGTNSISFDLKIGNGGAVPEPASWALMIAGFGATGAMLRRRRSLALA
jgi:hypothetical protein